MFKPTLFNGLQFKVNSLYVRAQRKIGSILNTQFAIIDHRYLLIIQINNFICILNYWCCIRRQEIFVFSYPYNEGTTFSGGHQQIRIFQRHDNNGIRSYYFRESQTNSLIKRAVLLLLDIFYKMNK